MPKEDRVHDWSILCIARLPSKSFGSTLVYYLHELRRKRERLYASNHEIRDQWMRTRFPKRHAYTFEAVSDLANALEYLYKRPAVDAEPKLTTETGKVSQPFDVRRPSEDAVIYWTNEWFMGKDELWDDSIQHRKIDLLGMGEKDMVAYLTEYEAAEEEYNREEQEQDHLLEDEETKSSAQ